MAKQLQQAQRKAQLRGDDGSEGRHDGQDTVSTHSIESEIGKWNQNEL